jgi:hypothetical protein
MPDARTGHPDIRTPRTGHRTSDTRRADTGRADAGHVPDAGHVDGRTLDRWTLTETRTGRPRHDGHPDILGTTTPLGRRTVLLSAAAAHAALGNHDGSAVRPPASARGCRLQCHAAAGSLAAAKRRLGALLSSDDFGSSVERTAKLHPLWRACVSIGRQTQYIRGGHGGRLWVYGVVACGGMWRMPGGGSVRS